MTEPRRWLEDPEADPLLREVLGQASAARRLDAVTRRRLKGRIAARAALPMAAAGWIFVKSAAAALGVVVGTATVGVLTGVLEVERSAPGAPLEAQVASKPGARPTSAPRLSTSPDERGVEVALNPAPSLPINAPSVAAAASSASSLAAEAAWLEEARRELGRAPDAALRLCEQHARRFPKGQLTAERTLIQLDALHRLGRDGEARALARRLLSGAGAGLYAERVRQLLGGKAEP